MGNKHLIGAFALLNDFRMGAAFFNASAKPGRRPPRARRWPSPATSSHLHPTSTPPPPKPGRRPPLTLCPPLNL
eukprot:1752809-Prymnesium_polylepis.1